MHWLAYYGCRKRRSLSWRNWKSGGRWFVGVRDLSECGFRFESAKCQLWFQSGICWRPAQSFRMQQSCHRWMKCISLNVMVRFTLCESALCLSYLISSVRHWNVRWSWRASSIMMSAHQEIAICGKLKKTRRLSSLQKRLNNNAFTSIRAQRSEHRFGKFCVLCALLALR